MENNKNKRILIFDFDGVLAKKWTHPEKFFPSIPSLIKELSVDNILGVASFNPCAEIAIKRWGLDHLFTCMRCGSNKKWEEGFYDKDDRLEMTKYGQIIDMLNNELLGYDHNNIIFFDDDQWNIHNVNRVLSIQSILIDGFVGLKRDDIPK